MQNAFTFTHAQIIKALCYGATLPNLSDSEKLFIIDYMTRTQPNPIIYGENNIESLILELLSEFDHEAEADDLA